LSVASLKLNYYETMGSRLKPRMDHEARKGVLHHNKHTKKTLFSTHIDSPNVF